MALPLVRVGQTLQQAQDNVNQNQTPNQGLRLFRVGEDNKTFLEYARWAAEQRKRQEEERLRQEEERKRLANIPAYTSRSGQNLSQNQLNNQFYTQPKNFQELAHTGRDTSPQVSNEPGLLGQMKNGFLQGAANAEKNFFTTMTKISEKLTPNSKIPQLMKNAEKGYQEILDEHPEWDAPEGTKWNSITGIARAVTGTVPFMLMSATSEVVGNLLLPGAGASAAFSVTYTTEYGAAYNEAIALGATEEQAKKAAQGTGIINGIIEALPLEMITLGLWELPEKFVFKKVRSAAAKYAASASKKILTTAATEGAEEALQEFTSNYFAKKHYDEDRKLTDGVIEAYVLGAITGGILAGGTHTIEVLTSKRGEFIQQAKKEGISEEKAAAYFDEMIDDINQQQKQKSQEQQEQQEQRQEQPTEQPKTFEDTQPLQEPQPFQTIQEQEIEQQSTQTAQQQQKAEIEPIKQETKVETSKNKKQIEQENQIFFKPEKKESRKGVKEEGSKRDIHYIKDTATGEVSRVEIATSKKTGEVTLERHVLKEDGTEYLSDMAQLKDLEAKHETKSLQDLVRLFSGYKTLIGDSSEFIKNPNKAQKAETSSTKSKDQISDKEQGISVKQKDKPKKKDVLPKKVIVGKVQPQTKQATKAKTEAKPTPKKKVKKQLSEKRIKELTKQNKDNAEMAKAEIERLKAKKSLTENEKATLKAYEETLKQSKQNLKELKKMEEQVKEEVKQEVKQETKQEVKQEKALVSETKAKQKQQKENNTGHDIIIQSNKKDNKPSELQKAYVEDGRMITTNLSEVLSTPTDLPNGLYVKAGSEWVKAKEQELASHFPTPVILDTTHELQISLTKNEIARLIATSAKDSVRPVFNGAHFFSTMGNLYSVSTDGFILSVHNMGETSLKEGESFTLSRQALEIMSKLNMTDVNVKLDENNQAEISSDSRTLTTRLIDGKFPPIKTIFPTSDTQITVNQADLKNALKDLKPYAKEKNHILVETTEDGLVLSAESEEFGKKEILIKIRKTEKGKEHSLFDSGFSLLMPRTKDIEKGTSKISLDPKFLERTTKNISGEEVKFGFSTPETAVAIMGTAETKPKKVTKAPKASKETQVKNPKAGASYGGFAIKQDHNWSDAKDIAELKKRASNYKTRIKTPELIAFSQILGADPTLSSKLTKKLGVFWYNDGEKGIKINKAIVNDPLLLNMVLSHEIGHLIDWLPTGFIKRSSLLTKVMTDKAQMKDMFNRVLTNKEVKEELKKLTQKRNPFDESKNENYTKYRYSAAELYAEFISELLTNPEGVKQIAPKFDKLWLENIHKKPSVQQAYLNMLNLGATGEYLQVRSENVRKTAAQAEIERENVLAAAKEQNKDILTTLAVALLRKDSAVRRDYKKAKKQSSDPSAVSNPIHALENLGHKSNIINGFKEKFIRPLSDFMSKNKLDINILHEFAMYDRIIHERGAVTNPAQLAMERMGDENWSKIEKYLPEDIFEMSATEQYATFKRVLGEKLYKDLMGYLPKDGGIANPFGFDHDSAKESRKYLEQSLGNDYVKYQEALRQVREFNKEVIEYAKKGGFYSPETIAMMEANPAYASFQVIDYVGTKLTAAVKHQSGTFKGIANTIFSTFEKNLSIINAVEINNAKQEVVKFYQESLPEDIKELGFRMGANKQKIFDKVSNSNLYGEIILYDNGVQKAYQVDKLVADIFTYNQSPVSTNFVLNSLRFMAKIPRAAFINFNIGFQISNFFFRDFQRYYRNNPFTSAFSPLKLPRQLKNYLKAIPTAYRIVKGENNASIEEMRKARVIIEDSIFNLETRLKEIPDSRVKMQKAFEARFGMENSKDANLLVKMFAPFFNAFTATGEIAETIPKVAGYLEYQDYKKRLGSKAKFNDQEAFAIIRNRLGSPNYQNKAGLNAEASSIMLFYNAIKEGILSDIEAVMDKKTRVNTLVNIGVLLLPAIYNIMQGMGEMGDEDKELMDSISEYDKRNYNILLLGRAKNGKAIYLRLPLSDSERTLRAIAYEMASKGEGDDFHDYVKSMSSVFTTVTEAVPGFNPVLKSLFDTKTYLSGENIWDSFYQDTVFTEEEMAVGGMPKLEKFLKYSRKNLGGSLFMSKSEKTIGEKEPIQKVVEEKILYNILGRFIRYTSSGDEETLRNLSEKEKQEQLRQTAREKQAVKQEVEKYKAGELTLNEAKKQAIKQVLGDDFSELGRYDEEQKATLKRVESRFLRESVAPEYEKKLKAVYYTSKKDAKIKVLIKAMEKMSKEEVREMLKEGTRTGLISQPVSDEAWREFNKQSQ